MSDTPKAPADAAPLDGEPDRFDRTWLFLRIAPARRRIVDRAAQSPPLAAPPEFQAGHAATMETMASEYDAEFPWCPDSGMSPPKGARRIPAAPPHSPEEPNR